MNHMKNQTKTISARRLRQLIASMAEDITAGAQSVKVSLQGNTFNIHLQGASINITINELQKGGEK